MKDKLGGKLMKELVALRPKIYSYLTDENHEIEKTKRQKMGVIKRKLKFKDYKYCFEITQLENKINQPE